jgi:methionyl-tRNA formyltransferase
MRVVYLGKENNSVLDHLKKNSTLIIPDQEVNLDYLLSQKPDLIISYGYRKILTKDITDCFFNKIINLHISYLPWNRGTYPNAWSFIEDTPKGVTIHYINEGIDTGNIILRKEVNFKNIEEETFKTTYRKLSDEIESLFISNWDSIKDGKITPVKQDKTIGSFHTTKQSVKKFKELNLNLNWEQKVKDFINKGEDT